MSCLAKKKTIKSIYALYIYLWSTDHYKRRGNHLYVYCSFIHTKASVGGLYKEKRNTAPRQLLYTAFSLYKNISAGCVCVYSPKLKQPRNHHHSFTLHTNAAGCYNRSVASEKDLERGMLFIRHYFPPAFYFRTVPAAT